MSRRSDRLRALVQEAHSHGPTDEGVRLLIILEEIMAAIDDLTTQFNDYVASVAAAFAAVDQAITDLQADLTNAGVDPAKVAALTQSIADAKNVALAEQAKVAGEDPGAPAPPPAPPAADPTQPTT